MGTTADKLKYLNDTKIEIKNALETTSTVMREYPDLIKKYIDNQPTKVASDGICSNAVDLPVKAVEIDGNSYQETTEGINKFNLGYVSQSSSKVLTDTGVNLKNCYGTETFTFENTAKTFKPNTTYTMKVKAKVVSRPSTIGAANKTIFSLYRAPSSSLGADARDLVIMTDKDTVALNTEKEYIHTFTTMSDMTNVRLLSYTFYGNNDGSTTYVPSGEIDVSDIMLVEGSYTLDNFPDYEPYTGGIPSPNPDYTQKIESIGESWNIFNKNAAAIGNGATKTVLGTGIRVTQTLGGSFRYIAMLLGKSEMLGKTYTLSIDMNKSANNEAFVNFYYGNTSSATVKSVGFNSLTTGKITMKIPDTFPDNCNRIYILLYSNRNGTGNAGDYADYTNLQIYEGTEDKPYRDYGNNIFVKQSGKNSFDNSKASPLVLLSYSNGIYSASDNDTNTTLGYKIQQYDSNRKFILLAGENKQNIDKPGIYYFTAKKYTTAKYLRIGNIGKTKEFQLYYPLDDINVGDYYTVVINVIDTTIGASKFKDVMLLKGKITSASYEPYHEPIITPINLQGNILSKVGDVKDILRVNRNGEVEITKTTWEETINTSDLVTLPNNNKGLVLTTSKKKPTNYGNNDYLVTNAQRNRTFNDGTVYQNPSNFVFVGSSTDTLETIKAKFNGGKILYQLATPQTITLPSISPIELWQGTNIFKLITNLDTDSEVEYIVDKDSVLNEVQTAMLEAEI